MDTLAIEAAHLIARAKKETQDEAAVIIKILVMKLGGKTVLTADDYLAAMEHDLLRINRPHAEPSQMMELTTRPKPQLTPTS